MENKYYTPTIEEFHVGFECEVKDNDKIHEWFPIMCTMSTPFDVDSSHYSARVKYLDREDIESLGFKHTITYGDYIEFIKDCNIIHIKILYNIKTKIINIENYHIPISATSNLITGMIIKNKSELKKLMKQLNII